MRIAFGITGSVAAYKSLLMMRLLIKAGHHVQGLMTESAMRFLTPLSVEAITGNRPWLPSDTYGNHITWAESANCLVVAPATANSMAGYAHGVADDPIARLALAFTGLKIIAPAMHDTMWLNPATQRNTAQLQSDNWVVLGPATGDLSGQDTGVGRLIDPEFLALSVDSLPLIQHSLRIKQASNQHILITAGGTQAPLDPVRCISNISSGKWGEMIGHVASLMGAQVTVLSSQDPRVNNPAINWIKFKTVSDLQQSLTHYSSVATHIYMLAAVSDFIPQPYTTKQKRSDSLVLHLDPTPDILGTLQTAPGTKRIGFCLESDNLLATARAKQHKKNCDYMIANDISMINQSHRSFHILGPDNQSETMTDLPLIDASVALLKHTL